MLDPSVVELTKSLQSRPWRRRFLPPVGENALPAFESRLGVRLPPFVRSFYAELCGGEEDRGYLGVLTLERASTLARRARVPGTLDAEASVTVLPLRERDDGVLEAVVCDGRFADTMWSLTGATLSPIARPDGTASRAEDWLREGLIEALQDMPAPLDAATTNVDLSGLGLTAPPSEIARAVNATSVSIAGNQLVELPESLRTMKSLQSVLASDNRLRELPSWIGELTQLRRLEVARNRIEALPPSLSGLERLEYLGAQGNLVGRLVTEGLSSLEKLLVSCNRVDRIDGDGPPALRTIDVGQNDLRVLPSWLGELSELQVMKLAGNPLVGLPPSLEGAAFSIVEIGALPSLGSAGAQPTWDWDEVLELLGSCDIDWLRIAGSPLRVLPDAARRLQKVRRLAIQSAGLEILPDFVAELEGLEELWLDDNRLSSVPPAIADHRRLRNIVLFRNPIPPDELARLRAAMPHVVIDA